MNKESENVQQLHEKERKELEVSKINIDGEERNQIIINSNDIKGKTSINLDITVKQSKE